MRLPRVALVVTSTALAIVLVACRAVEPPNRPVQTCQRSCESKAARQCSDVECERGCHFILDRLAEHNGNQVIACVAKKNRRCSDLIWAECASSIGPHADGGPPAPPPPNDDYD